MAFYQHKITFLVNFFTVLNTYYSDYQLCNNSKLITFN